MPISQRGEPPGPPVLALPSGGTARSEEGVAESGITFRLWPLYQRFWLLCLLFPLISLVREPHAPWQLALGLFSLLFFATSYTWLTWSHPVNQRRQARTRSRLSLLLLVVLSLQVTVFSLLDGPAWLWLFIGVSAIAGVLLPMRAAGVVVVLFTALPLAIAFVTHRGVAGIEERERLSRDLHDLLGQTLSMITLKSELARHLITEEPERCAQELSEIERVARHTLHEVREAVAGYRQPRLISELEGARQLLEAAGINYQIEPLTESLPPALDAMLAWTVREGVTNVIRHSHARLCLIHLIQKNGTVEVEVLSDVGHQEQVESTMRPGLGLAGLRERVSALGGHMEAGSLTLSGKEHFRVRVELPMKPDVEAPILQEERS